MFQLNNGQERVVQAAIDWFRNSSEQVFQYSGNAGTGKSVVLHEIIRRLQLTDVEVAPMSFIGAAAIVMRTKGLYNARTIHSWLYNPVEDVARDKEGKVIMNEYLNRPVYRLTFEPKPLPPLTKLIIVDEAGAVPVELKKEIESRNIKVLACGDLDQLPPVGGNPGYLTSGKIYILDEIMRQAQNSVIVYLAQRAKQGLPIQKGIYNEVEVIDEDELEDYHLQMADMVICGKNSTRNYINKRVREDIFHRTNILPMHGDKVVCRKNNWGIESNGINLVNGLIGEVTNYPDISRFNGKFFTIDFKPYNLVSFFPNIDIDYKYFITPCGSKSELVNDRFSRYEKFEYAYCITTHISQGSQYRRGVYLEEYLNKLYNNNLNYTGITRFSDYLIYVKRKRKFY